MIKKNAMLSGSARDTEDARLNTASAKEKKGQIFYIGFCLWLSTRILEQSMFSVVLGDVNLVFKIMEFSALLVMVCGSLAYIINSRMKYIPLLSIIAIIFLVVLFSDRLYIAQLALIIFMSQFYRWHKLLKYSFYVIIITCLAIIASSLIGIIPNYLFVWGARQRYALGFKYVTYLPAFVFTTILLYYYLFRGRSNALALLVFVAVEISLFYLTKTRFLCSLGVLSAVVLAFIAGENFSKRGLTSLFLKWSPLVFALFPGISFAAAFFYDKGNSFLVGINNLLSNRLQLGKAGLEEWGVHPFGADYVSNVITWEDNIASLPTMVNVVDSSYLSSFIFYGWIVTTLMLVAFAICTRRAYLERDYLLVGCLVLLAIMGLFEPRLFLLEYNPFLFAFAFMIGGCINRSSRETRCLDRDALAFRL